MAVVVKIGGARAVEPAGALADVASLVADGEDVAVVHGGSTAVDETLERMGIEPEYVETPGGVVGRFTDEETMDVFKMAMGGLVNTDLVTGLQAEGVDAVGLTGVDGRLLTGPRKDAVRILEDGRKKIRRGDHSGSISAVNDELLTRLLDGGYTPVASPPMLADDGVAVNTDADRAAAAVACAIGATLVVLTDVPGVLRDPDDPETVIDRVADPDGWADAQAAASGFMTRKLMAAREALDGGAEAVVIGNANVETPIRAALDGAGTRIVPDAVREAD